MESAGVDNDTRGWIMCIVSGIACVMGATIICVDVLVRLIPSQRNFRIQDSNAFLACSLSLSFGVMMFSALYSMLPESKEYFLKDKWDKQTAGFVMMGCFVAGFFGIQVLSRLLHQFMPSHVVDCDHTHSDVSEESEEHVHSRQHSKASRFRHKSRFFSDSFSHHPGGQGSHMTEVNRRPTTAAATESTPLLVDTTRQNGQAQRDPPTRSESSVNSHIQTPARTPRSRASTQSRRPSMLQVQNRVMSFVRDTKPNCDEYGPCFGYTDPCGQECFKHLGTRSALTISRAPTFVRTTTEPVFPSTDTPFGAVPEDEEQQETSPAQNSPTTYQSSSSKAQFHDTSSLTHEHDHDGDEHDEHDEHSRHGHHHHHHEAHDHHGHHGHHEVSEDDGDQVGEDLEAQHHHHVATNAFLSIGLQTVIAIALHKFPEGFITYATNHANPSLGFNVFMALAVHNVAEGFAMALPLYMALGSRWKAMLWSSLLGGASQPAGAGLAVLWFKLANRSSGDPVGGGAAAVDNTTYACVFAATAGIMTSVALQLFVESLSLNHNRNLSIFFAFLGMTLLGVSNALVTH